jgi:hypothetical protein
MARHPGERRGPGSFENLDTGLCRGDGQAFRPKPPRLQQDLMQRDGVTTMHILRDFAPRHAIRQMVVALLLSLTLVMAYSLPGWAQEDEATARKAFITFEAEWLKKVNFYGDYGQHNVKVEKDDQGRYCASYRVIAPAEGSEVKSTGVKASPFVGLLHYEEQTFASRADTPEQARQGPFQVEKEVLITEIFRYSNGKWVF